MRAPEISCASIRETNGLILQYVPKYSNVRGLSNQQVEQSMSRINNRPRKALRFLTPEEVPLPENRAASKAALMINETVGVDDIEVLCHSTYFKAQGNHRSQFNRRIISFDGVKWESGAWDCKCLFSKRIDGCS